MSHPHLQLNSKNYTEYVKNIIDFIENQNMNNKYTNEQIKNAEVLSIITARIEGKLEILGCGIINTNNSRSAKLLNERMKIISKGLHISEPKLIHLPEITNIVVRSSHRRIGLGEQILTDLLNCLQQRDILLIANNSHSKNAKYAMMLINKIMHKRVLEKLGKFELVKFNNSFAYKAMRVTYEDPTKIYEQLLRNNV